MAGKLVEIHPELSLHADEIRELRLSGDRSRLLVRTAHNGTVEVLPVEGETTESAYERILAAVNSEAESSMQLIEIIKGAWVDPADVAQVIRYRGEREVKLIMRGDTPSMRLDGQFCSPEDIASRINAVMRERRSGLGAI